MMKLQETIFGPFWTLVVIALAIFTHIKICFQEVVPRVVIVLATIHIYLTPTLVEFELSFFY